MAETNVQHLDDKSRDPINLLDIEERLSDHLSKLGFLCNITRSLAMEDGALHLDIHGTRGMDITLHEIFDDIQSLKQQVDLAIQSQRQ